MAYVITRPKPTMQNAQQTPDGTSSTHSWQCGHDREREQEARRRFDPHGVCPEEGR